MKSEQTFSLPGMFDDVLKNIVGDRSPETWIETAAGDCRELLGKLDAGSVHFVVTDPPYFLDGLDSDWDDGRIRDSQAKAGGVGGLPVGMKFDTRQGRAFQDFMQPVALELLRVLVPGGFFVCFSQPRLYHRLAVACEDAGFEIRELLAWHYTRKAQFKAFSQDHFVKRMKIPARDKRQIIKALHGCKTPQLRPQFEAMMLAQKPREGTCVDNWLT
ncbi:Modification methylase HindIII [Candidatus Entotheonellaceae bacterium PAL068K]